MRKKYIDNIRWLTVVPVVVYHVTYIFNASGVQFQDALLYMAYSWFMLLLFVVSGMSARFLHGKAYTCDVYKVKNTEIAGDVSCGAVCVLVDFWIFQHENQRRF